MNKLWSEQNKTMQTQMKKKDTYEAGINTLFVEIRKRETQPRTRGGGGGGGGCVVGGGGG